MTALRLLGLALFLSLAGCSATPSQTVKKTLGEPTIAILEGASRVEVFRIKGDHSSVEQNPPAKKIGGYPITAQGQDQGKDFAAKLAKVLLDEKTYSNTFARCFDLGVAFRVWNENQHVDVVICFKCNNFYCGPPVAHAQENASFEGSVNHPQLVQLAKAVFPTDMEIQALTSKE